MHTLFYRSFEIELENVSKRNYCLNISDLLASIVPEECTVKVCVTVIYISIYGVF